MNREKRLSYALLLIQIISSIVIITILITSKMIPFRFVGIAVAALTALCVISWTLLFKGDKNRENSVSGFRRIIAYILAIITLVLAAVSGFAFAKVGDAISSVTDLKAETTSVGVYVMKNDAANSIEDAADYDFGYTKEFDYTNTAAAIREIKQKMVGGPDFVCYDNTVDMVKALYRKEIDAVMLNESLLPIVEEQKKYENFESDTKLIYEYKAEIEINGNSNRDSKSAFLVYLSGSDTRHQLLDVSRSDVNILMAVNTETKEILLVNTPRDYYVPISVSEKGERDKLTHCGMYGIGCSMDTLSDLYGQEIDYYAQINFVGFERLIDKIGGITINSDTAFSTGGLSVKVGENHFNGAQALTYARDRHHQSNGDNDRGKNQMKVISAMIDKLTMGTALKNFSGILNSLKGMFATDVPSYRITALAKMQLDDMATWDVHSYAVKGTGGNHTTFSMPSKTAYVMYPNQYTVDTASDLIARVLAGEKLSDSDLK